jgi:hypothetical protein
MLLHSAMMRRVFRTQILSFSALVLFLALPNSGGAYSVLTHEAIIDAVWGTHLQPLLQKRFPDATR